MRFKVDGQELSAEGLTIGEICEAEKYLRLDFDSGTGAKIAVALYAAKKRAEPGIFPAAAADWVMAVDMTQVEDVDDAEDDDAGPPDDGGK